MYALSRSTINCIHLALPPRRSIAPTSWQGPVHSTGKIQANSACTCTLPHGFEDLCLLTVFFAASSTFSRFSDDQPSSDFACLRDRTPRRNQSSQRHKSHHGHKYGSPTALASSSGEEKRLHCLLTSSRNCGTNFQNRQRHCCTTIL